VAPIDLLLKTELAKSTPQFFPAAEQPFPCSVCDEVHKCVGTFGGNHPMAHVFISYARSTEAQARRIADALRKSGFEVWRDDEIPANRAYSEVIEERLTTAKAVVVVWSAEAAKSHWVRAEADKAREAGTLI
jgi:hypothetical protein